MGENDLYEALGGHQTFENLVSHFYALVTVDPILRPMYPDTGLGDVFQKELMFLLWMLCYFLTQGKV